MELNETQKDIIARLEFFKNNGKESVNRFELAALMNPHIETALRELESLGIVSIRGRRVRLTNE